MKIYILSLAFLLICLYTKSQNNLVGNPGFETNPGDFTGLSGWGNYKPLTSSSEWGGVSPWGVPAENALNISNGVGSPDCHKDNNPTSPTYGTYYGFTGDLEYIVQTFPSPMVSNHIYYIQFDCRSPSFTTPLAFGGLHFNTKKPRQGGPASFIKRSGFFQPNIGFPNADYADKKWHTIKAYWQAKDNFGYMTLGNIRENIGDQNFGLDWDNFIIVDVGTSTCPATNWIQNLSFQSINGIIYKSQTLTASGNNVGAPAPTIAGDVHITSTAAVVFKSATEVALMPGFHADANSTFDAIIAPCSDAPCITPSAYIGLDNQEYCSQAGQTVQLGGPAGGNETYQWTTTDASGNPLNILNSTTISNPLLTVPSGSGFFNISEVVTSGCDGTTNTADMTIFYDNSPVTTPVISVISPSNIVITSSSPYANFTIQGNSHTESVNVTLEDGSGNIIDSWDIDNFPSYQSNSYQYNFIDNDNVLSTCSNYSYHIHSKNICSDNISTDQVVTVGPPASIIITNSPNFFSPNGDGINDQFCFGVVGATSYDIQVIGADGGIVYNGSGNVTNNNPCVWAGQCNSTCGYEHTNGIVCDGTYYFVLNFYGCNNITSNVHNYLTLSSYCSQRLKNPNDTLPSDTGLYANNATTNILTSKLGSNIKLGIFPNPTNGNVSINYSSVDNDIISINVYSSLGIKMINLIDSKSHKKGQNRIDFDTTPLQDGAYMVEITSNLGSKLLKLNVIR